jgi:hypothetical protein
MRAEGKGRADTLVCQAEARYTCLSAFLFGVRLLTRYDRERCAKAGLTIRERTPTEENGRKRDNRSSIVNNTAEYATLSIAEERGA